MSQNENNTDWARLLQAQKETERQLREQKLQLDAALNNMLQGLCMFDSALTDYCITNATPFHRDPMKELAAECRKQGVKLCFYHSIMDWHHPDYVPRRPWDTRPATHAILDHYVDHMEGQLRELEAGQVRVADGQHLRRQAEEVPFGGDEAQPALDPAFEELQRLAADAAFVGKQD